MTLSEPVDYLTEENYRPYWLKDGVTKETLNTVAAKKLELIELGKRLAVAERFYMVGSGGSYSVQLPIVYIAEKYTKVPIFAFSGADFIERSPIAIDEKAIVIGISQGGTTKEVVDAVDWSNSRGATTFGLTQKPNSKINENADIGYGWEAPGVSFGKLMSLYYLFGSIFSEKGYDIGGKMITEIDKLPTMLPKMIPEAKKMARKQGIELKDYDPIFVLGGGINWGLAYQYALSTLMEMCWVHGIAVNISEFGHGALELLNEKAAAIILRGRSQERVLEDGIIEFCKENGVKIIIYDSQGIDVDNLITPFSLFIELEWLSYYLSLARNRRMGVWRYYDKRKF